MRLKKDTERKSRCYRFKIKRKSEKKKCFKDCCIKKILKLKK